MYYKADIIFQKGVDNFEIEHKTCSIWLGAQFHLKALWNINFQQ